MAEQGDGTVKLVVIKASPTGQIPVKNVQVQDVHVVINPVSCSIYVSCQFVARIPTSKFRTRSDFLIVAYRYL